LQRRALVQTLQNTVPKITLGEEHKNVKIVGCHLQNQQTESTMHKSQFCRLRTFDLPDMTKMGACQ